MQGIIPNLKSNQDKLNDFYFIEQEEPEKALEMIIDLVKERIPKRFGFDSINDIQVLTPMHRGTVGAGNLNIELQKALNPGEEGVSRGGRLFRVNDKVMQIVNNYDKEVYNGDIGQIASIDEEAKEVKVTLMTGKLYTTIPTLMKLSMPMLFPSTSHKVQNIRQWLSRF